MTNYEKYKDLLDLQCVKDCDCNKCEFESDKDCGLSYLHWLLEEYKEDAITKAEADFLKTLPEDAQIYIKEQFIDIRSNYYHTPITVCTKNLTKWFAGIHILRDCWVDVEDLLALPVKE